MQHASDTPDIASLLAETRAALTYLRADELEALALRAEAMLQTCPTIDTASPASLREHRLLGDLLSATGENLRVLRRTRADAEGSTRWVL